MRQTRLPTTSSCFCNLHQELLKYHVAFQTSRVAIEWLPLIFAYEGFLHERKIAQTTDVAKRPAAKEGIGLWGKGMMAQRRRGRLPLGPCRSGSACRAV